MTISDERVRELIAKSGMSQGEFAEAVGLDAPKLSKSLGGIRRFSSLDIARIADFGEVSVDWLLGAEEAAVTMAARRSAGSVSAVATAAAERFTELRETAIDLGYPLPVLTIDASSLGSLRPREGGEKLALAALEVVGDPNRVLDEDLATLIEESFGIDVAVTDLGDAFDGLAVCGQVDTRLILAAPTPTPARQRFTLAHELAHVLMRDDQEVHLDEDVWAPAGKDPQEIRANEFAAAFLMPEDLIRERVHPGFDHSAFAELAVDVKVSPHALAIRLERLNLIDKLAGSSYQRLSLAEAARLTGRTREVTALSDTSRATRAPRALAEALFAAYGQGRTTLRAYAAALGVDPERLREDLEATAGG